MVTVNQLAESLDELATIAQAQASALAATQTNHTEMYYEIRRLITAGHSSGDRLKDYLLHQLGRVDPHVYQRLTEFNQQLRASKNELVALIRPRTTGLPSFEIGRLTGWNISFDYRDLTTDGYVLAGLPTRCYARDDSYLSTEGYDRAWIHLHRRIEGRLPILPYRALLDALTAETKPPYQQTPSLPLGLIGDHHIGILIGEEAIRQYCDTHGRSAREVTAAIQILEPPSSRRRDP